jgi:hypothetical protein
MEVRLRSFYTVWTNADVTPPLIVTNSAGFLCAYTFSHSLGQMLTRSAVWAEFVWPSLANMRNATMNPRIAMHRRRGRPIFFNAIGQRRTYGERPLMAQSGRWSERQRKESAKAARRNDHYRRKRTRSDLFRSSLLLSVYSEVHRPAKRRPAKAG